MAVQRIALGKSNQAPVASMLAPEQISPGLGQALLQAVVPIATLAHFRPLVVAKVTGVVLRPRLPVNNFRCGVPVDGKLAG